MPKDDQKKRGNLGDRQRESERSDVHTQGVKGLMILNGGGSLALLTALTHILTRDPTDADSVSSVAMWLATALAALLLGLVTGAWINHFRYESSQLQDSWRLKGERERGKRFGVAHRVLFAISLGCFSLGALLVILGVWASIGLSIRADCVLAVLSIILVGLAVLVAPCGYWLLIKWGTYGSR